MRKDFIRIALGTAVVVGILTGCGVESYPSLTLTAFHGAIVGEDGGACVNTEVPISGMRFDAGVSAVRGDPFILYLAVSNNLASTEDVDAGRVNTNKVSVTSVEVEYDNSGVWSFLPNGTVIPAGQVIDTDEIYFEPISAIDGKVARLMVEGKDGVASPLVGGGVFQPLLMTFRVKGQLQDGTEVESNALDHTIYVCNDCLPECEERGLLTSGCSAATAGAYTCIDPSSGG